MQGNTHIIRTAKAVRVKDDAEQAADQSRAARRKAERERKEAREAGRTRKSLHV